MTHKSPDIIDTEGHFLVLQLLNWVVIAAQQPFRKLGQEGREGSWSWIKYPTQMNSERSQDSQLRLVFRWLPATCRMNVTQLAS